MITVHGLNGMKATVLAYSITKLGQKLITWEIEYPRLILAELNTHRQLSRNSYSSRAVPFNKMLEQLHGEPVRFGANQAGMQDKGEDFDALVDIGPAMGFGHSYPVKPRAAWGIIREKVIGFAKAFADAGYHKQVYNRPLEAWQMQKTVLSATEVDNFFWLRDDDAADPTIRELARIMKEAMESTEPELLEPGQWHLPYIDIVRWEGNRTYGIKEGVSNFIELSEDEAIKVSCARCAAVSYRNEGYGVEKSIEVYDRLVEGDRKHASAFEHCGTPIKPSIMGAYDSTILNIPTSPNSWEPGISHMDRQQQLWSGNFKGWIQYRKLIPGECYNAS
jgi:hypothetical protein